MVHPDFGGDAKRVLEALGRSLAIIEFEPNGTIIAANENFCRAFGYEPAEIKGQHHSLFVDPETPKARSTRNSGPSSAAANSTPANTSGSARAERKLASGGIHSGVQQAGTVLKVVEVAHDITAAKLRAAENAGKARRHFARAGDR